MGSSSALRLARVLRASLVPIVIVLTLGLVGVITSTILQGRTGPINAEAGSPDAAVLHVRAARNDDVTGRVRSTQIEAWFDTATGEGKLVERTPDGALINIVAFANGTLTTYRGDARQAIIRRNVRAGSSSANRLRFELFRYAEAAKLGSGQIIGRGQIGQTSTERVRIEVEETPITADIDPATGLTLREEFAPVGDKTYIRETTYNLIERVARSSIPADVWRVDLPPGIGVEEYNDGPAGHVDNGELAALPYVAYGPTNEGQPVAAFRRNSAAPSGPRSDAYYLIYRVSEGEVQVISAVAPDPAFQSAPKMVPQQRPVTVQIGGTTWTLTATSQGVQGSADLGGTLVTIVAPTQSVFERVAGNLRPLNR
jgi:hypothetical protein